LGLVDCGGGFVFVFGIGKGRVFVVTAVVAAVVAGWGSIVVGGGGEFVRKVRFFWF
jgi:hypothetical protein